MNRICISGFALLLVAVSFLGVAPAGDFQSFGDELTLTGSVNRENQFVGENGQFYELAVHPKADEISALPGHRIEIKDAVLDQDGQKIISVTDDKIANE